jgi:hypothetical protein
MATTNDMLFRIVRRAEEERDAALAELDGLRKGHHIRIGDTIWRCARTLELGGGLVGWNYEETDLPLDTPTITNDTRAITASDEEDE